MKRRVRDLLPLGSGRRVLRFSDAGRRPSPSELDDEDQLYLALGRIVANWSLIEIASGHVLMGLIGSRDETLARAIVAGQRVENVWETIEVVLSGPSGGTPEELAEFRAWRRSANRFRRRRNEAVHSAWSLTGGDAGPAAWDVMSQRAKRGARADLFPAGVPELEELARDIADCEERLAKLHARVLEDMLIADDEPD
jgi:hypothetical protein